MGFGLLFIGYFITFVMTMNNFKFIIAPLGYVVTMLALLRLGRFEPRFYFALICSLLLILFGAYGFLHGGADKLGIALPVWVSAAKPAVDWALFITEAALNITLLVSISALAEKVGLGRQQHGAKWRMIVVGGYYVLDTTRMLYFWNDAKANSFLVPVALLFKLLWIASNLVLIYSCYMRICPEGDEDMPVKEQKLGFVKKFLEETSRARKEIQEYRAEQNKNTQDPSDGDKPKRERGHKK